MTAVNNYHCSVKATYPASVGIGLTPAAPLTVTARAAQNAQLTDCGGRCVFGELTSRKLAALNDSSEPVPVRFGMVETETVQLPAPAMRLLREILDQMARGHGVTLTPVHAELTTRQAADLLQVSRTHLVQLLDDGKIPCRKVGSHRRVRTEDIIAYRRATQSRRRDALNELTAYDQELGLQ